MVQPRTIGLPGASELIGMTVTAREGGDTGKFGNQSFTLLSYSLAKLGDFQFFMGYSFSFLV